MTTPRLGILASHPVQYYAPLYRELAKHLDLHVYFAHRQTAAGQADAGFGVAFDWDVDLLGGYPHTFLENRSRQPGTSRFSGCDTPEIATHVRAERFDAFLVMGWYLKSHWQAILACRRAGIPVLVRGDSHLVTPRNPLKRLAKAFLYPLLMRQFAAGLPVGHHNRQYLTHYGLRDAQLFASPHCIDTQAFAAGAARVDRGQARQALGLTPETAAVLFVGKLLDRKRPVDLLQAVARFPAERPVTVLFAGDGPRRDALQAEARRLGVEARFLGFRNQTELPEAYVMADVLCLPSEGSETWGLVCNEALACGTPVVVSDAVGCAPDLALEGQTGAVFPLGDVDALANALQRALTLPRDSQAIAAVSARHSVEAAAAGIVMATQAVVRGDAP